MVAYHARVPWFGGGYVGVDVFFVLSGYLITRLLVDEIESRGRLDFARFYARRARRLVPAAALVLFVTLVAGAIIYSPIEHRDLANTAVTTAVYASNFWFARLATDYLAPHGDLNPLLHTWSLAVEEQFYLGWPILVLLGLLGVRRRGSRLRLVVVMSGVGLASFAGSLWLTRVAQPWAFFGSPTRAWEFAIGGLACLVPAVMIGARPLLATLLGWLGFGAVLSAGVLFSRTTSFPGVAAVLPALGTAVLLVAGASQPGAGVAKLLAAGVMQVVGRLSYSWYLWHWPMLVLAEPVVGPLGVPVRVALAGVAFGLAAATHATIENPVRFNPYLVRRAWTSLAVTAGVMLIALGSSLWLRQAGTRWAGTPSQSRFARAHVEIPPIYENGCHLDYFDTGIPDCSFGAVSSDVSIVLFGDSHAAQWFPALESVAREKQWKLVSLTKSGCPAVSVEPVEPALGRHYVECSRWRAAAVRRIVELHPAVVVMASASGYIRTDGTGERLIAPGEWRAGIDGTLNALAAPPLKVLLLEEPPLPGFHVPQCLARAAWNPWAGGTSCTFRADAGKHLLTRRLDQDAAAGRENVSMLDLSDSICSNQICESIRNGLVIYRDDHHLSVEFSTSLASRLAHHLEGLVRATTR